MSYSDIKHTIIDYEIFKLKAYINSGVFPKRYFGYFDEKWDTKKYEIILKHTTHKTVQFINQYLKKKNSPLRITDIEVAITFISEGGAILLRENRKLINNIHPIGGIGLDSIKYGFGLYPKLIKRLDSHFKTNLGNIIDRTGKKA